MIRDARARSASHRLTIDMSCAAVPAQESRIGRNADERVDPEHAARARERIDVRRPRLETAALMIA